MSESSAPSPNQILVVLVSVPDADTGHRIAEHLVAQRLAACVNRLPGVESLFHWKGKVERAEEELLVIKTRQDCFEALSRRVAELHPYEVPEILALPVFTGRQSYLDWVEAETSPE